jgi:hypothetical protein
MTIIKFPSRKNEPAFLNDIKTNGYQEEGQLVRCDFQPRLAKRYLSTLKIAMC